MELSDACDSPSMICAAVASCGSHGMSNLHVCVDRSEAPPGSVIVMGHASFLILMTGAPCMTKWPVAPESLMAWCLHVCWCKLWVLCSALLGVGTVDALVSVSSSLSSSA